MMSLLLWHRCAARHRLMEFPTHVKAPHQNRAWSDWNNRYISFAIKICFKELNNFIRPLHLCDYLKCPPQFHILPIVGVGLYTYTNNCSKGIHLNLKS